MKLIGFISRNMYHTQNLTMISPELVHYKLPLREISSLDIDRMVSLNEETNEIQLETLKEKSRRMMNLFIIEKQEGKPIIGIDAPDTEMK